MSPPGVTINRLADSVSVPGPDIPGFTMSLFVVPGTHLQEWDVTTKWKGVGCQGDGCPPSGCQGDAIYPLSLPNSCVIGHSGLQTTRFSPMV